MTPEQMDARLVELSANIDEMLADPDMPQAGPMNVACELFMIAKRSRAALSAAEVERDELRQECSDAAERLRWREGAAS